MTMEVFSVFATLSLVDLLSSPLDRIKRAMKGVDLTTAGLGERMGNLALAMGPPGFWSGLWAWQPARPCSLKVPWPTWPRS